MFYIPLCLYTNVCPQAMTYKSICGNAEEMTGRAFIVCKNVSNTLFEGLLPYYGLLLCASDGLYQNMNAFDIDLSLFNANRTGMNQTFSICDQDEDKTNFITMGFLTTILIQAICIMLLISSFEILLANFERDLCLVLEHS